ncbi:MAG: hypothetical protein AABW59_04690 [archaeon]
MLRLHTKRKIASIIGKTGNILKAISIGRSFAGKPKKYETSSFGAYFMHGHSFFGGIKPITFSKGTKSFTILPQGGTFEADQSIGLISGSNADHLATPHAWLGLGFEKGIVIVESMQTRKDSTPQLNAFRRITGKQALNFMLQELEKKARESNFGEIRIRAPQTLYYYNFPHLSEGTLMNERQVRAQMKVLYARVASAEGYKREGNFYVKRIEANRA